MKELGTRLAEFDELTEQWLAELKTNLESGVRSPRYTRFSQSVWLVIDIETLGTPKSYLKTGWCPIYEWGLAVVDPTLTFTTDQIVLTAGGILGREGQGGDAVNGVSADTLLWHVTEHPAMFAEKMKQYTLGANPHPRQVIHFLRGVVALISSVGREVKYTSQGKDFDYFLLSMLAEKVDAVAPWDDDWGFTNTHCLRDLTALAKELGVDGVERHYPEVAHDAKSDAIAEAETLITILSAI